MPPFRKAAQHEEERLLSQPSKPKKAMGAGKGRQPTRQATARAQNMSFRLPKKPAARDKGLGTQQRNWIRIQKNGEVSSVQLRQHQLMQQFGIQPRDLRLLDLLVATSYPSAILSRDSAIVVNLERFKCIITTDVVLLPAALFNDGPDAFFEELQQRLRTSGGAQAGQGLQDHIAGQGSRPDQPRAAGSDLPFELCALEVCLEAVREPDLKHLAH